VLFVVVCAAAKAMGRDLRVHFKVCCVSSIFASVRVVSFLFVTLRIKLACGRANQCINTIVVSCMNWCRNLKSKGSAMLFI